VTLISSRMTFVSKRVFPVVWFGFLGFFVVSSVAAMRGRDFQPAFLVIPIAMALFGYFLMKKLVFDLVDEVWDDGAELVVKNKGQTERVPLGNVMNVSYALMTNPARVTLTLRNAGAFGKEISFLPPARLIPFSRSPIVDDLIARVDAARSR
jgi:hypothetical protein